jgi:sugar phosphate isomerase/epimerase
MHVGLLTARFGAERRIEEIVQWAAGAGFKAMEVTCGPTGHLRPEKVLADDGTGTRRLFEKAGIRISSLACYRRYEFGTPQTEAYLKDLRQVMDAAKCLGVETVCALLGFPAAGKDKLTSINEFLPPAFGPVAEEAGCAGLRIAFENWYATCLQNLEHFAAVARLTPANVGFNFDPSHLCWQEIDYLAAVTEFAPRIFHTHAKDVAVDEAALRRLGVLEKGWWRYVIPGLGVVDWGQYVGRLKLCGFDGVLSVEHEDRAYQAEEGFALALKYLGRLC